MNATTLNRVRKSAIYRLAEFTAVVAVWVLLDEHVGEYASAAFLAVIAIVAFFYYKAPEID